MARQIVEITTDIDGIPAKVRVAEFPTIEDTVLAMAAETIFTRKFGEALSTDSPIGRDIKDFLIKSNVVGE